MTTSDQIVKETPMPDVGSERSYWMKQEIFAKKEDKTSEESKSSAFSFGFGASNEPSGRRIQLTHHVT